MDILKEESDVKPTIPSKDKIFQWILDLYSMGNRIPGTEPDHKAEEYLHDKLVEFGFEDVPMEPIDMTLWLAKRWNLEVHPEDGKPITLPCFYVPYTAPTDEKGISGQVVYVGEGRNEDFEKVDVRGKIVMADVRFLPTSWGAMEPLAYFMYDPKNTIPRDRMGPAVWVRTNCLNMYETTPDAYASARKYGATGFIGILMDYPRLGEEFTYYAPYDGVQRPLTGLWISREAGKEIKEMLKGRRLTAKMVLEAKVQPAVMRNVYGILQGKTDEIILIHSHHDGPFGSAVEDASGCAMVLSLANYFIQVPKGKRNRTLVFLFTAGHFYLTHSGAMAFIEEHRDDLMPKVLIDLAIEHIAKECLEKDGETVLTRYVEPRSMFTIENPTLISTAKDAIVKYGIERISILRPIPGRLIGLPTPIVPTDAHFFWRAGVSIYSLISGPMYLFDISDTPDKVADDQLVPLTKMFIDIIRKLDVTPADVIKPEKK